MGNRTRLVLVALALSRIAFADPGDAEYQEGRRHYDLQEWDQAIEAFKQAYAIRSDAASLFNIAQSYRLKGDCVTALGFYKTYRRNFPDEKNIAKIDGFITELEPCAKEREGQQQPQSSPAPNPSPAPPKPLAPPPPPPPQPTDSGHGRRVAGLTIGAVGVAALTTGIVFTFAARARANDVTKGGDPTNPPTWDPSVETAGKRDALLAMILVPTGVAALAGGAVLYMTGHTSESTKVSAVPTGHGGMLVWHRVW